jgi:hypothetical protein
MTNAALALLMMALATPALAEGDECRQCSGPLAETDEPAVCATDPEVPGRMDPAVMDAPERGPSADPSEAPGEEKVTAPEPASHGELQLALAAEVASPLLVAVVVGVDRESDIPGTGDDPAEGSVVGVGEAQPDPYGSSRETPWDDWENRDDVWHDWDYREQDWDSQEYEWDDRGQDGYDQER